MKVGSTTISVTDTDAGETLHIPVHISDTYSALKILKSNVEGSDYRILEQDGNEYKTLETGTYKFGEWGYEAREEWELTLICGDNETVWRITDADKNKNGYKYYVSDVVSGIGFPGPILTKIWDPNFVLPTEFCFTDVANPDRSFITGRADLRIPNDF